MKHGYSAYSNGVCRCPVCKAAKADYQSQRRTSACLETTPVVADIKHGRFGYEERGCRCETCVDAYRTSRREWARKKRVRTRQAKELAA